MERLSKQASCVQVVAAAMAVANAAIFQIPSDA